MGARTATPAGYQWSLLEEARSLLGKLYHQSLINMIEFVLSVLGCFYIFTFQINRGYSSS